MGKRGGLSGAGSPDRAGDVVSATDTRHFLQGLIVQEALKAESCLLGAEGVLSLSQRETPCVVTDRNLIVPGCRLSACGLLGVIS